MSVIDMQLGLKKEKQYNVKLQDFMCFQSFKKKENVLTELKTLLNFIQAISIRENYLQFHFKFVHIFVYLCQ